MSQQVPAAVAALLGAMQDSPAVPDGWDVALHLSEPSVQSVVRSNWNGTSQTGSSLVWVSPNAVNGQHDVVEVNSNLPPPAVSLNAASQAVHVNFGIDNGTQRTGKLPAETMHLFDPNSAGGRGTILWGQTVAITPQSPLQLAGPIPVGVKAADDGRSFSIGLNRANANLTLSSPANAGMFAQSPNQSLDQWLPAAALSGQIGNLTRQTGAGATVLTPASVATRVATSVGGQPVLQILTGSSPGATAPPVSAPVSHPDTHDFSLIVSSKAIMAMIASGYNVGTGVIKLDAVPPQDGQLHWFAQVHEPMVFQGTFGNQNGDVYLTDNSKLYLRFGGSTDQGLKLFTFIDPASTVQLQLDLAAHYPTGISGAGADQVVGLQEGAQSVAGNGFYEAIVQPQLEAFLKGDIRSDMTNVRMTAISDLILRDLALSGHGLQFEVSALPAELLIAGSLVPHA